MVKDGGESMFTAPPSFTTRPTLQGNFGMAASTHWLASGSAMAVLERGGNAFDAAVAAGFVLQVVEPNLNGAGGEVVAILATGADPTPRVLAGCGFAPHKASVEHFRSLGLSAIPGAGTLAAPVPGQFDAWLLLLRDYGTWELDEVLAYAIHYARSGFAAGKTLTDCIAIVSGLFDAHWRTSFDMWTPSGRVPKVGDTIRNTAYARTLERLALSGSGLASREERIDAVRREWAEGFVAAEIVKSARESRWHSDGAHHGGLLTSSDLASYSAAFEPAVVADFHGHTIAKAGPWSQGPALLQALGILAGFDPMDLDPSTGDGAHVILEAIKLSMADRDAYFGDGAVPLDALLAPDYLASRRGLIGEHASLEFRPGDVLGSTPYRPPLLTVDAARPRASTGEPTTTRSGQTRGDTCHVDVVDRWGNLISATPSGGWLQSSPHITELGFALSTRLQQCWLDEGSPSGLRPGTRPRITLTPTLVMRDGLPVAAVGTPGGDGQDQWQLLYLLRTIVGGYTPQEAIDAPAFQSTSFPNSFWPRDWTPGGVLVEDRLGTEAITALTRRGHVVTRAGDWSLGRLSVVTRDPATGELAAAANPRGAQGYAAGR